MRLSFVAGAKPEEVDDFNRRYEAWIKNTRQELHRRFHYVVAGWLSDQGAKL
jgi:hypothetical protein